MVKKQLCQETQVLTINGTHVPINLEGKGQRVKQPAVSLQPRENHIPDQHPGHPQPGQGSWQLAAPTEDSQALQQRGQLDEGWGTMGLRNPVFYFYQD